MYKKGLPPLVKSTHIFVPLDLSQGIYVVLPDQNRVGGCGTAVLESIHAGLTCQRSA